MQFDDDPCAIKNYIKKRLSNSNLETIINNNKLVITKKQETNIPTCSLTVNGLSLRQVNKFKYLGTMINWDARDEIDLNTRTAQAKASFQQMKTVLCNKNISFKTRYRVLKCYIQGVSQRYSPPLELNPKGLGKKQKYCYKLY